MKGKLSPKDLGLSSDSFTSDLPDEPTPRIIANVRAWQKVGKTDFSVRDVPDPIVIFNFDQGLEGVIEQFKGKKQIIVAGVPQTGRRYPSYHFAKPMRGGTEGPKSAGYLDRVKKAAVPIWERWIHDMREAYESDCRSMVVDTAGAAHALGKFAFHGMSMVKPGPDDPYGTKTGELNAIFQGIIADGLSYDKNVIWLSRVKEKWDSGGQIEEIGYKQLPYEVQVTIELGLKKGKRTATIVDSRLRGGKLNGMEYEGEDYSFAYIAAELTKTDIEIWR